MIVVLYMLWSLALAPFSDEAILKVNITEIQKQEGKVWLAVYRPEDRFGEDEPKIYKIIPVKGRSQVEAVFSLNPGRYAVAVYHDQNDNAVLDKNFLGIPKEPYGFSNNFRPRLAPPKFSDCAFTLPASGKEIIVRLAP
ncbi:uncharacterized protein (DUF2141 family) [Dyadobacter jejuensis]|uniref:Uncharacterized protein (DUF2141 family) n=1 Tax=Dyadobacter jejuensis TaxID=1082580 RepID=A0A316ARZ4_9BACT|nr:DUF2141 domain-containing protein [Dyadobacter jejuensis]PWJ60278.1 uncharacterized protein (DUF2141 family) [Dyadobacter jejuensis]